MSTLIAKGLVENFSSNIFFIFSALFKLISARITFAPNLLRPSAYFEPKYPIAPVKTIFFPFNENSLSFISYYCLNNGVINLFYNYFVLMTTKFKIARVTDIVCNSQ